MDVFDDDFFDGLDSDIDGIDDIDNIDDIEVDEIKDIDDMIDDLFDDLNDDTIDSEHKQNIKFSFIDKMSAYSVTPPEKVAVRNLDGRYVYSEIYLKNGLFIYEIRFKDGESTLILKSEGLPTIIEAVDLAKSKMFDLDNGIRRAYRMDLCVDNTL